MVLHEAVAKLSTVLPALTVSDAKFASDLIASYKKYGSLTPKQAPWIERLIARAAKPVFSAPLAVPAAVSVGNFAGVIGLFAKAKDSGLKFPKVRLALNGVKIVLSLNGPKSKAPGAVSVNGEGTYPNRSYYGRVTPEGVFQPSHAGQALAGLADLLGQLASQPARVAKDYGKLLGHCCFCGKSVGYGAEVRSALAGFGPDCAEHYGLKAEWLAAVEKAEAKASVAPVEAPVLTDTPESDAAFLGITVDELQHGGHSWVAIDSLPATALVEVEVVAEKLSQDIAALTEKLVSSMTATVPGLVSLAQAAEQATASVGAFTLVLPTVEEMAEYPVSEEFVQVEPVEEVYDSYADPGFHLAIANETPTLTVSPGAQAAIDGLAESLAKVTGAVAVTVTDGPLNGGFGIGVCYFCEGFVDIPTQTVEGFVVCAVCAKQLGT